MTAPQRRTYTREELLALRTRVSHTMIPEALKQNQALVNILAHAKLGFWSTDCKAQHDRASRKDEFDPGNSGAAPLPISAEI